MTNHRHPRARVSKDIHHNKPDHPTPTNQPDPTGHTKSDAVAAAHQSSDHPNPTEADNTRDDRDVPGDRDTAEIDMLLENFEPVEALQYLRMEVVELEALTNAADEAVIRLPYPPGREERRAHDRVYALVTKAAEETSALVRKGDRIMDALQTYTKRRSEEP